MAKSKDKEEPGTEMVNWEERLAAEAKDAAAVERPQVANISMRAGVMSYQGQPLPGNQLECIVAASVFENRYYAGKWDPNNIESPDCFALSESGEDMVPHPASKNKQHTSCRECPHLQWKTVEGKRRKECGEIRRLMLLPAGELDAETVAKTEAAMLKVSVTNVKHWGNYVNNVAASYSRPPWSLITKISAAPDVKTQFRISFETTAMIPGDVLGAVDARRAPLAAVAMAPYDAQSSSDEEAKAPKENAKY